MSERIEKARELFVNGYNCSQSVVGAYSDLFGMEPETAMKFAEGLGGGMGRMREVCGTVSAMLMVLGILYGYDADAPNADVEKTAHYARVQEIAGRFREEMGSIICREILANHVKRLEAEMAERDEQISAMLSDSATPTPRSAEYYKKRPCAEIAASAARLLDTYIQEIEQMS